MTQRRARPRTSKNVFSRRLPGKRFFPPQESFSTIGHEFEDTYWENRIPHQFSISFNSSSSKSHTFKTTFDNDSDINHQFTSQIKSGSLVTNSFFTAYVGGPPGTPELWYDGNDIKATGVRNADLTAGISLVDTWASKGTLNTSSYRLLQLVEARKPLFVKDGHRDGLQFDGTSDFMFNGATLLAPYSIIVIYKTSSTASEGYLLSTNDNLSSSPAYIRAINTSSSIHSLEMDGAGGGATLTAPSISDQQYNVCISRFSDGLTSSLSNFKLSINGGASQYALSSVPVISLKRLTIGARMQLGLPIGGTFLACIVCQIVVYNRLISDSEVSSIMNWAQESYGLFPQS